MEKWKKRAVDFFTSLVFGTDGDLAVVPYYPQKLEISAGEERYFKRSTPEAHGISSKRIYNMLCELEAEERADVHNLIVLRDGEVICECSKPGYGTNIRHLAHSMSKTVTGIAVCMLASEGRLSFDDRLVDIFPEIGYEDKRFAEITVEHLLTMQSGVTFSEAGSITELGWLEAFFGSGMKFRPGTDFAYNSMNSYVLARIIAHITEGSLSEYLEERLFRPLGIRNYYWELGPDGVEKGGWGLFMSAESWAKIGYTFMMNGRFGGEQVIPREVVAMMALPHSATPKSVGDFNYGYHVWISREPGEILFNGMFGQNVWICPKNKIVAVVNCANNELFQVSPALSIIRKSLGVGMADDLKRADARVLRKKEKEFFVSRRYIAPLTPKHGLLYFLGLRPREVFDERFTGVLGTYRFAPNKVGLLPVLVLGMQNNIGKGLKSITLRRDGESLLLDYLDGEDSGTLELGLYGYKENVISVRGERYMMRCMAGVYELPFGGEEFRIELVLPEMPNARRMKLVMLSGDRVEVSFEESPNQRLVEAIFEKLPENSPMLGFLLELLEKRFGKGFVVKKLARLFNPVLIGINEDSDMLDDLLLAEQVRMSDEADAVRLIRSVVAKFFREAAEPEETSESRTESGFSLSSIVSRLFGGFMRRGEQSGDEKPENELEPQDTEEPEKE